MPWRFIAQYVSEVYAIEQRAAMTVNDFGALVARALVAHQRYVRNHTS